MSGLSYFMLDVWLMPATIFIQKVDCCSEVCDSRAETASSTVYTLTFSTSYCAVRVSPFQLLATEKKMGNSLLRVIKRKQDHRISVLSWQLFTHLTPHASTFWFLSRPLNREVIPKLIAKGKPGWRLDIAQMNTTRNLNKLLYRKFYIVNSLIFVRCDLR